MANPSKQKGSAAEKAVVEYLKAHGYPMAERRVMGGTQDRGDIAGVPRTVIEVKAEKALNIAAAVDEAEIEANNDSARWFAAVLKRRMRPAGDWYAVMPFSVYVEMLTHLVGAP